MSDNNSTPEDELVPVRLGNDFQLIQHSHNVHCAVVNNYMTKDQLENPRLWSFVATSMKPHDHLEVRSKDGTMFARGMVTFAQGSIAKIRILDHYDLEAVAQPVIKMQGFVIRQISASAGWEIVDERTGDPLKDQGLMDQNAAIIYLQDHLKHKVA